MEKIHRFSLIFSIILFLLLNNVSIVNSDESGISFTGNILFVGCDDEECYDTIQSAINDAQSGDTIFVFDDSSPYFENIVVDKTLRIIGENKETTIIDGRNIGNVVYISGDGVNFSNFTIQNGGNDAGLLLNSDGNLILNNNILNGNSGIKMASAHYNLIEKNKIENCAFGQYIVDSTDNDIVENILKHNDVGFGLFQNSNENKIYRNVVSFSDEAVNIDHSSYNEIYWNLLSDSEYAIYSTESSYNKIYNKNQMINNIYGVYLIESNYFSIYSNIITNNEKYGIYLIDSSNTHIHENSIENNEYGIFLEDSSNNDIYWNDIKHNINGIYNRHSSNNDFNLNNIENNFQFGINIYFSSRLKISYNNFILNYNSAYFKQSFFSFNSWKKNFWDDWGGIGAHRIYGEIDDFILIEDWFMLDMRPVDDPYVI